MAGQALSAEDWYWKGDGQVLLKNYSDNAQAESLYGVGVFLSADYLERSGLAVGYNYNHTNYKSGLVNMPYAIDENLLFLSGRVNYYPDYLPGRLGLRLDGYIGNDEIFSRTTTTAPGSPMGGGSTQQITKVNDKFMVVNPVVSFLNYSKTCYVGLGYAYSSYHSNDTGIDDVDIRQWSPALGFGFNRSYDWLQIRAYLISRSNSNRSGGNDATSALEAKWTHWFSADGLLDLDNIRLAILAGESIYAVDSDAYSLSNIPDVKTGMVSVGAEWKLNEGLNVLFQGGYEAYEDLLLNERYNSTYIYFYVSRNL